MSVADVAKSGQRPRLSHACYVGRVGALAVALGIGAAVASLSAVAYADSDSSTGPSQARSDGSSAATTPGVHAGPRRPGFSAAAEAHERGRGDAAAAVEVSNRRFPSDGSRGMPRVRRPPPTRPNLSPPERYWRRTWLRRPQDRDPGDRV